MPKKKSAKKSKSNRKQTVIPAEPDSSMIPILKKLKSEKSEDRAWAATAISNLVLEEDSLRKLLPSVIPALLETAQDAEKNVVLEAMGALRNTLISGGSEVCLQLLSIGGMNVLSELLIKVVGELEKEEKDPNIYVYAEQILACLWSLCEASEDALNAVTFMDMIRLLVTFFTDTNVPLSLQRISGQFLNTLSEENEELYKLVGKDGALLNSIYDQLLPKDPANVSDMNVLSCSVLFNVRNCFSNQDMIFQIILRFIGPVLSFDFHSTAKKVEECVIEIQNTAEKNTAADSKQELVTPATKYTNYLETVNNELSCLQLALELVANLFSEEVPEHEIEDADVDGDEEMEVDAEDMIEVLSDKEEESATTGLVSWELLEKIFHLSLISSKLNFDGIAAKGFIHNSEKVQIRALAWAAVPVAKDNLEKTADYWNTLFERVQNTSIISPLPVDLLDALVTGLWSISQKIYIKPNQGQIDWLSQSASSSSFAPEILQVKVVGILSQIARAQNEISLNKKIGDWIMTQLTQVVEMEGIQKADLMSELLNAIYDIYADAAFDYDRPVFVEGGYLPALFKLVEKVQHKTKNIDKRKAKLTRNRADEALLNLKAFINYKRDEKLNITN